MSWKSPGHEGVKGSDTNLSQPIGAIAKSSLLAPSEGQASSPGAETASCSGTGFRSLNVTIAGRSVRDESGEQLLRGLGHLIECPAECDLVRIGGPREAAQLADKLE